MENTHLTKAKQLLNWNKKKLVHDSDFKKDDIADFFAPSFIIKANNRTYNANFDNYFEFLERFRANIKSLSYEIQEFIVSEENAVTIPLVASVAKLDGATDIYDAMMLIKYNSDGKIIHWQEIYCRREIN